MMYVVQGGKKLALKDVPRVMERVVMTTGSHHYQTYWVASPRYDRLLQTLPLVYLIKEKRWIPREAAFMRPPDDAGRMITQWNHHCIRCHSTAGNPGLNQETGMLDSRVAELGISCEACHGPAEKHVQHYQNPVNRYRQHLGGGTDPTIVNPARLDHRASSQVCGQCHGVFIFRDEFAMPSASEGPLYRPGEDLERARYYIQHPAKRPTPERREELSKNPEFFRERWWDDGTILAGGREYSDVGLGLLHPRKDVLPLLPFDARQRSGGPVEARNGGQRVMHPMSQRAAVHTGDGATHVSQIRFARKPMPELPHAPHHLCLAGCHSQSSNRFAGNVRQCASWRAQRLQLVSPGQNPRLDAGTTRPILPPSASAAVGGTEDDFSRATLALEGQRRAACDHGLASGLGARPASVRR
jgi:hypothetical protein